MRAPPAANQSASASGRPPILALIQWLRSGGAEKQLLLAAGALARQGFPVRIVTLASCRPHPRIERMIAEAQTEGVEIVRPSPHPLSSCSALLHFARSVSWARGGIVWCWGSRADLLGKLLCTPQRRVRLVCSLRSAYADRFRRDRRVLKWRDGRVAAYVSNTHLAAELLERVVPGVQGRTHVVYNALSPAELARPPIAWDDQTGGFRGVLLGNVRLHVKGYDYLIELAQRLQRGAFPAQFTVAGRADELPAFRQAIAQAGVENSVAYHGEAVDPDAFLRLGHSFLLLSRVEGTPNSLIEAMNLGLPCLSTRVGDVGRLLTDGEQALLVESGDLAGMEMAVRRLWSDREGALQMGARARAYCQRTFTLDSAAGQLAELFCRLAGVSTPYGSAPARVTSGT